MAEIIPILRVSETEFSDQPASFFEVEGYPTVWWRDEAGYRFWPKPICDSTGRKPLVTILYFASGEPAGFIVQ